jgi:dienelactone hydrolase
LFVTEIGGLNAELDMRRSNRIFVEEGHERYFRFSNTVRDFVLELCSGWNFLSIPLQVDDPRPEIVFDGLEAFTFAGTGTDYVLATTIEPGKGYFVFNPVASRTVTISGTAVEDEGIDLDYGWNMTGVIAGPPYAPRTFESTLRPPVDSELTVWDFPCKTGAGAATWRRGRVLQPGRGYMVYASRGVARDADPVSLAYVPAGTYSNLQHYPVSGADWESATITGAAGRTIPIRITWAPDASPPYPVVIWSHDGNWKADEHGITSNEKWAEALAEAGYAVIRMSHVKPSDEQLDTLCEEFGVSPPTTEDCADITLDPTNEKTDFRPGFFNNFHSVALCRPGDTTALIAAIKNGDFTAVELDEDRIALAGWSGGSQTVMQLAGASRIVKMGLDAFAVGPHPDISAFVALSNQGAGFSNFYDQTNVAGGTNVATTVADVTGSSWDNVVGPMICLTGEFDQANKHVGFDRLKPYFHMPAGSKRLLYSTDKRGGLGHSTFNLDPGDLEPGESPQPHVDSLITALKSSVLAFLDWHVRDRPEADAWLNSDAVLSLLDDDGDIADDDEDNGRWETK